MLASFAAEEGAQRGAQRHVALIERLHRIILERLDRFGVIECRVRLRHELDRPHPPLLTEITLEQLRGTLGKGDVEGFHRALRLVTE